MRYASDPDGVPLDAIGKRSRYKMHILVALATLRSIRALCLRSLVSASPFAAAQEAAGASSSAGIFTHSARRPLFRRFRVAGTHRPRRGQPLPSSERVWRYLCRRLPARLIGAAYFPRRPDLGTKRAARLGAAAQRRRDAPRGASWAGAASGARRRSGERRCGSSPGEVGKAVERRPEPRVPRGPCCSADRGGVFCDRLGLGFQCYACRGPARSLGSVPRRRCSSAVADAAPGECPGCLARSGGVLRALPLAPRLQGGGRPDGPCVLGIRGGGGSWDALRGDGKMRERTRRSYRDMLTSRTIPPGTLGDRSVWT